MPTYLHLAKYYSSAYVLDKGKLSRIASVLEQASTRSEPKSRLTFTVKFSKGTKLNFSALEEVFALDNTVANPIVELGADIGGGDTIASVKFESDPGANISVNVYAYDNKLANEFYGELEEQVERTLSTSWFQRHFVSGFLGCVTTLIMLLVIAAFAFSIVFTSSTSRPLDRVSDAELLSRARSARTDHEKLDIIYSKNVNDLRDATSPTSLTLNWRPLFTFRAASLALPLLLIIGAVWYLASACYPAAVFAWGDYEQYYYDLLARRRSVWTVVVVALLLGIVSNLFVVGLPQLR